LFDTTISEIWKDHELQIKETNLKEKEGNFEDKHLRLMLPAQMALFLPAKERKSKKEDENEINTQRKQFIEIVNKKLNDLFRQTA